MLAEKSRNSYFDIFKAMLMFCVIAGHAIETGLLGYEHTSAMAATYVFFYTFHMPAFIFLFGFFSKSTAKSSKKIISRIVMFLALFAIGKVLYYGGFKLLNGEYPAWMNEDFWSEDSVPWYMLSAALLSVTLWAARKVPGWIMIPAAFVIGLFSGAIPGIGAKFCLSRTLIYLPLFLLGYYFPKGAFDKLLSKKRDWVWLSALAMAIVWVLLWAWLEDKPWRYVSTTPILYCNNSFEMLEFDIKRGVLTRAVFYLSALAMTFFAALTAAGINHVNTGKLLPQMGRNTLAVYLIHYPLFLFALKVLGPGVSPATAVLILLSVMAFWSADLWEKAIRGIQNGVYWLLSLIFPDKKGEITETSEAVSQDT